MENEVYIHPTAEVAENAMIGAGSKIWHHCQIRHGAAIGEFCIFGKGVFIDADVQIGDYVKVQNYVSIYHGVTIEDGVFIGPHVCFTNDLQPRAINADGTHKSATDWVLGKTIVSSGASIGANSTIRCGITIGEWAMIGAGSVVTRDIPAQGLVYGNPAMLKGFVCKCGQKVQKKAEKQDKIIAICPVCGLQFELKKDLWESAS